MAGGEQLAGGCPMVEAEAQLAVSRSLSSSSAGRGLPRLALVLDALGEAVTLHDAAGQLLYANATARSELGLDRLDVDERQRCRSGAGQQLVSRCGDPLAYEDLPFRAVFRGEGRLEATVGLSSSSEPLPQWLRVVSFREPAGEGTLPAAVTFWMRADGEDPGTLRAMVAHELRTPLSALQLTLHTLNDRLPRDPTLGRWATDRLALARAQCRRIGRLIDRLLAPEVENAYDAPLELEPTDVADLVRDVALQQAEKLLRAGCHLQLVLMPASARVDRVRLEEVIENLLANACKYARGAKVEVRVERAADGVRILVRDDGPGIPEAERENVFARYGRGTASPGVSGQGLGLYLVRRIARAHGGGAWVNGRFGGGSEFVVQLPASPPTLA
jgi:signal transduction histidine kinase